MKEEEEEKCCKSLPSGVRSVAWRALSPFSVGWFVQRVVSSSSSIVVVVPRY